MRPAHMPVCNECVVQAAHDTVKLPERHPRLLIYMRFHPARMATDCRVQMSWQVTAAGSQQQHDLPAGGDQVRRCGARPLRLVEARAPVRRPQRAAVAQRVRLPFVRVRELQEPRRRLR